MSDIEIAVFGKQVQDFLETDIGRYILGASKQQVEDALDRLKTAQTIEEVQELQNEIKRAELVPQWLDEAIHIGLDALSKLEEEREV